MSAQTGTFLFADKWWRNVDTGQRLLRACFTGQWPDLTFPVANISYLDTLHQHITVMSSFPVFIASCSCHYCSHRWKMSTQWFFSLGRHYNPVYLHCKGHFPGEPGSASSFSDFFLCLFQKRTFEDKWKRLFLQFRCPSCQPANRNLKVPTQTNILASSFLCPPLCCRWKDKLLLLHADAYHVVRNFHLDLPKRTRCFPWRLEHETTTVGRRWFPQT